MSEWKDEYSVKVSQLDGQHREFFLILEELSAANMEENLLDIEYIMAKLDVYALYHFTCEEHYLAKYGFPGFEKHKLEHDEYRNKLSMMKEHQSMDTVSVAREAHDFLLEWWTNHIQKTDKEYSSFLTERIKHIPFN